MGHIGTKTRGERKPPKTKTPTFLLELPLVVEAGQAARVRAHLEVGRQFYNAVLSVGQRRLRQMRADPAWREACAIPRTHPQERKVAFSPCCGSVTASPSTLFTSLHENCGSRG